MTSLFLFTFQHGGDVMRNIPVTWYRWNMKITQHSLGKWSRWNLNVFAFFSFLIRKRSPFALLLLFSWAKFRAVCFMRDQFLCVMIFECFFTVVTVSCLCEETRGDVTVCVVDNAFVLFTTCFSLRHEHLLLFTLKRNCIQLKNNQAVISIFNCTCSMKPLNKNEH